MSGFGDAMAAAMKRRLEKQAAPTADDRARQAAEAKRRLGYDKPQLPDGQSDSEDL